MPHPAKIKQARSLKFLGNLIHQPNLWHLNRRSVSRAMLVGLFCAFLPIPFQMVVAALGAIAIRANVAISVALVWITNPLTMPAIFYFTYRVGLVLIGNRRPLPQGSELSFAWVMQELNRIWEPLLLGSVVCGIVVSLAGFTIMRLYWRWHIIRHWRTRRKNTAKSMA
jgi:uncharacterized protein (DUF2062 family)